MAAEATILALSSRRMGAVFTDQWAQDDRDTLPGLRMAGRITLEAQTDTDPWPSSCRCASAIAAHTSRGRWISMAGRDATRC